MQVINQKRGARDANEATFSEFKRFVLKEQRLMSKEIQRKQILNQKVFEKKKRERNNQIKDLWDLDQLERKFEFENELKSNQMMNLVKKAEKQERVLKSVNGSGIMINWKSLKKKKNR